MSAHLAAETYVIAVHNPRLDAAQRLAMAVDAVSGRTDLARPLAVLVESEVAVELVRTAPGYAGVGEIIGHAAIPASDFRFVKEEQRP